MLASQPGVRPIAGGTDLMVAVNFGHERPESLLAIGRVPDLLEASVGERVRVGAAVTFTRLLQALGGTTPAMSAAVRTIGSPQIRNAGTIGGNLGTCSPAGDTLPVLAALAAEVVLAGPAGERRLPLERFMLGPKRSDLRPGELVTGVEWWQCGCSQAFLKIGTRNAMVIAVANLAMVVDRRRRRVRIAIGSVGPTILRASAAEAFAEGLFEEAGWDRPPVVSELARDRLGALVAEAARPIDDVRGTASYRRYAVGLMAARAIRRCAAMVD